MGGYQARLVPLHGDSDRLHGAESAAVLEPNGQNLRAAVLAVAAPPFQEVSGRRIAEP